MNKSAQKAYQDLIAHEKDASLLGSTLTVLGWDQQTMMPRGDGAAAYRARQTAQLAGLVHQRQVDPRVGEWLAACEADEQLIADPTSPAAVNVRELRREYDRATRLPQSLVEAFSEAVSMSQHVWKQARAKDDFALFQPHLERIVELSRQRAECFGYASDGHVWDALAEGFEPGMRSADIEAVFAPLRTELTDLVADLVDNGTPPDRRFAELPLPVEDQRQFVCFVADKLGFAFDRGRLDTSAHPFCCGIHRDDVRMTTRFSLTEVLDALSSTMHEAGHGLYEQNLPGGEHADTPLGSPVGLAIHESQSRMIENQIGRSRAFWQWCQPQMEAFFGTSVAGFSVDELYGGSNIVQPSLIRTEADEATYNLHIMIRFDIERAMLSGDLAVADLPAAWDDAYERYLGIRVPNDAQGCLQDVHWSEGFIGYFPTYTLGNLYSAQFFEKLTADVGDVDAHIAAGRFAEIIDWLRENIHAQGKRYLGGALCEHVTGRPLEAEPLLRYLRQKLRPLYGLG